MLSRLARRSFHTARIVKAEAEVTAQPFKWNHLVTQYTSPSFITRMKQIDQQLAVLRAEADNAPKTIDAINWSEWEAKIEDKAQLKQIRQQYESFTPAVESNASGSEFLQQLDQAISASSKSQEIIAEELKRFKAELAEAKQDKIDVHNWTLLDYFARYPGLSEQIQHEYMEGYQLPTDAEDRLEEADLSEFQRALEKGQPIVIDPELPLNVGEMHINDELKKVEMVAQKVFGSTPVWKSIQADIEKDYQTAIVHKEEHHDEDEDD